MNSFSESQIEKCSALILNAKSIAVLTGAGISTGAGIPDFRGPQGLYVTRRYDPEKVFDIEYFVKDPKPFYEFARDFIGFEEKIKPTFTHNYLAELERHGKLKGIVTQNIDGLHQRAGSKNVLEIHGGFLTSHCLECEENFSFAVMKEKLFSEEVPSCACGGVIKPDVVFFGEDVKYLAESYALAASVDLFFVVGTSCVVHPAASVPQQTKGKIVVVNKGAVDLDLVNVVLRVEEDIDGFFREVASASDRFIEKSTEEIDKLKVV